jgi:hypothetical protein
MNYTSSLISPSLRYQCWPDSAGKQTQQNRTKTLHIKKLAGSGAPLKAAVYSGIGNSFCLTAFVIKSPVQPHSESLKRQLIMIFPVKTQFHEGTRNATTQQNQLLFPQIIKNGEIMNFTVSPCILIHYI